MPSSSFKASLLRAPEISEKCQPFIRLAGDQPMFHGERHFSLLTAQAREKAIRKDRKPQTTKLYIHELLDNWFALKFVLRPRSESIFCTGLQSQAQRYGKPYYCFPIGEFHYLWCSEAGRAVRDTVSISHELSEILPLKKKTEQAAEVDKYMELYEWHTTGLQRALRGGAEVAVLVDKVILVPTFATDTEYEEFIEKVRK